VTILQGTYEIVNKIVQALTKIALEAVIGFHNYDSKELKHARVLSPV
jgi:hypothetical protein